MTRFKGEIISGENYRQTKNIRRTLFLGLGICTLLTGGGRRGRGLLDTLGLGSSPIWFLCAFVMICTGIALVISYFYSRKTNKKGYITIYPEKIVIKKENEIEYLVNEIKDINIIHDSFVGKDFTENQQNFIGNNFISFSKNNTPFQFEFTIESFYAKNKLLEIIEYWKANNISICYQQV